jgi:hypothetical protein
MFGHLLGLLVSLMYESTGLPEKAFAFPGSEQPGISWQNKGFGLDASLT